MSFPGPSKKAALKLIVCLAISGILESRNMVIQDQATSYLNKLGEGMWWQMKSSKHSVQFSRSAMSDSLRPHGLQHARPPCPSPTPRDYSDSCPSSQWCHPTISSSVIPFSTHLQSFPALGSFPVSQFFTSGGPKYWSFSFSISPSNEYSGLISFRMNWLDLLAVQGTLKSLLQHYSSKASILQHSVFFIVQLSHPYMTTTYKATT